MIEAKNLKKIYINSKGVESKALNGVSAEFGNTGLVFLLGKSGSGKTTLLNLLGGLDQPTGGEIIINGKSSKYFKESDYDDYRNAYVGFIFQEYHLINEYSVGQNVALALELQAKKANREEVDKILRSVNLVDQNGNTFYERKINELSGGQKQRVAIARALIKNPKLILADEPTGALDSQTSEQLYALLKELSKERLVIVVTHDRESAEKYGDRIITIADGKIVSDSCPVNNAAQEIKTENQLLVKSKLPVKRSFAIGVGALRHKKLRLVVTILLTSFMCFIFGFASTTATCDVLSTQLEILYENGCEYAILESNSYFWYMFPSGDIEKQPTSMTTEQKEAIKDFYGPVIPIEEIQIREYNNLGTAGDEENDVGNSLYMTMVMHGLDMAMEISAETAEFFDIVPDPRLKDKSKCHLPNDLTEIAISDCKADLFMRCGYKDENGNVYDINSPDDMIGKKLGSLTICGVYTTPESHIKEIYDKELELGLYDEEYDKIKSFIRGTHICGYSYVCEDYFENDGYFHWYVDYLVKLKGNMLIDRAFLKSEDVVYSHINKDGRKCYNSLKIASPYSFIVDDAASFFTDETFLMVAGIIGVIFAVVSILMFMNYLNVSIDFRKRQLGILRALGATKRDVILICLFESLVISTIVFVLSMAATCISSAALNAYYSVPLFIVGLVPISALVLLCYGVAALATILPVYRISKRKPVDIIK